VLCSFVCFPILIPHLPSSTLFPYTTLFRSHRNPAKRQLREQLWSLRLCDLPEHSSIQRGEVKAASAKAKKANDEATSNGASYVRSEEHTSELQSRFDLVCRLLLEKKKKKKE